MLHKLYKSESTPSDVASIPSDYTVTGNITELGQHIPIRCLNSDIIAYVNDIQVNKYEFQCVNEYLRFGDSQVIIVNEHQLILTGIPVAPINSHKYIIRSLIKSLTSQQSSAKLY